MKSESAADGPVIGRVGRPAAAEATVPAWECGACGHVNRVAGLCESCGVSRRYLEDPPLDLPYTPRLSSLPSFWLAIMWSLVTLAGLIAAATPWLGERLGLGPLFFVFQVPAAALAAGSSFLVALWERWFNQVELTVPHHVRSGEEFEVQMKLVPYRTLAPVSLTFRLVDRYFERTRDGVNTASKQLERTAPLLRGTLSARRANVHSATFVAPFPVTPHTDVRAEITADLLGTAGILIPSLRLHAQNLREHGGYFVEARLSVGIIARRYQKRVLCYLIGDSVHVG